MEALYPRDRQTLRTAMFLRDMLPRLAGAASFGVRLWDGTTQLSRPGSAPDFILVINRPEALRKIFLERDQLSLGEAFVTGEYDIEGDIVAAFRLADRLSTLEVSLLDKVRYGRYLRSLPASRRPAGPGLAGDPHTRQRDEQAVRHHYDAGNDFFRLWLDRRMVYSCAYFGTRADDLDTAQVRKLDYICRKLRLQPGERLLDIGCGWGGLILHAAREYGVTAVGITLSPPQAELANARIREAGLSHRCRAEVRDYRDAGDGHGFHKIVSVGMVEHVGRQCLADYFARAFRLLLPGGVFLNHGITVPPGETERNEPSFIDRYVFPDGELIPVADVLGAAEGSGFEVRDLESLREHYALTLRHWVERLGKEAEAARRLAGEMAVRVWRIYMAGSAHGFEQGRLNVYQALLVKPEEGRTGLPLTRNDWYSPPL